jgi:hypothetical protein
MHSRNLTRLGLAVACAIAAPAHAQQAGYALLVQDNQLAFSVDGAAMAPTAARPVLGLQTGEQLVAIDVRPQNGRLYVLAQNPKTGSVRLYLLDIAGPDLRANAIGEAGGFVDALGNPIPVLAQGFNIDFNPSVDRLRVVSTAGLNFRMNPNNGALVDGDFGTPGSPTAGLNPDGGLNLGGAPSGATGTAYSNSAINTTITTQYSLNHVTDTLYIQNRPNAGTLTQALPITLDGSPLDFGPASGIDIAPGINAPSSNAPAVGQAVAVLSVAGQSRLYRVDLATGVATAQGAAGLNVVDVAVLGAAPTANVLSRNGDRLGRFELAAPGSVSYAPITGVTAGERLVGIDMRPATGQLYALGINAASDRGTLYVLEPQTGANALATPVGMPSQIGYVDAAGQAIDLSDLPAGFDFNPTVDRIRFVDASGLNARINPLNGAAVDGDVAVNGLNPDGSVQAELGTQLVGTAYTSSFPNAPFTTQYTVDQGFGRLSIQNPPNNGVQSMQLPITLAGQPFEFAGETGFDIPQGVVGSAANQAVVGEGYFTASDSEGTPTLFAIRLDDASVQSLGAIADGGNGLTGLSISAAPNAVAAVETSLSAGAGDTAAIRVVLLSGNAVPVHLRTVDGSAVAGDDYSTRQASALLSGANPAAELSVPILGDATPGQQFSVEISGPFAGPIVVTVTLIAEGDALFSDGFESP